MKETIIQAVLDGMRAVLTENQLELLTDVMMKPYLKSTHVHSYKSVILYSVQLEPLGAHIIFSKNRRIGT